MTVAEGMRSLSGRTPGDYRADRLHDPGRSYQESNCYSDLLIELFHAHGYEPLAMFGHLARMDFEGDQWTFFKPPQQDIERLFGIDIHEMQPYRSLPVQIAEQLAQGRTITVELDSWYMPDTGATSYHAEHVKTSVAPDAIDVDGERLWYFHGTGLWELSGEDFRGIFRVGLEDAAALPPYTELVRFDFGPRLEGEQLRAACVEVLAGHLAHRPDDNPFVRFGQQLAVALPELLDGDLELFHAYAFATVRMAGSAFEILGDHARWLFRDAGSDVGQACSEIVDVCKALSFRLARRRAFDPASRTAALGDAWDRTISGLVALTR